MNAAIFAGDDDEVNIITKFDPTKIDITTIQIVFVSITVPNP